VSSIGCGVVQIRPASHIPLALTHDERAYSIIQLLAVSLLRVVTSDWKTQGIGIVVLFMYGGFRHHKLRGWIAEYGRGDISG